MSFMEQEFRAQQRMADYLDGLVVLAHAHGLEVEIVYDTVLLRAATAKQAERFRAAQKIYDAEFGS